MKSHRCALGFRSGEFAGQGRMSNPVRLFRVRSEKCGLAIFLDYRVGCTLQQGQNNRLYKLYDVEVRWQTVINVYQMRPVIKHYAIPNHDARCSTGLMLGEMGWFIVLRVAAIPVDGRHSIREHLIRDTMR
ncbi:hypothetical protein TNCV_2231961 [Trichonephila clavipes]|nr:hypothetical protein TNCV_2231961 [Trichonephila clavipes]